MPDNGKTVRGAQATAAAEGWTQRVGLATSAGQHAFEYWARGMSRLCREMADFTQSRLLEDSAMWEKLAACRDPATALETHRRFATKASADYLAASQKFAQLITEVGHSCASGLRQRPPETD